jgi:zinc finger FYVE domain-containing protein 1
MSVILQGNPVLQGGHNAARRVIDGLTYVSDTLVEVGAKPAKVVTKWVTDQIAPSYWIPNSEISVRFNLLYSNNA